MDALESGEMTIDDVYAANRALDAVEKARAKARKRRDP